MQPLRNIHTTSLYHTIMTHLTALLPMLLVAFACINTNTLIAQERVQISAELDAASTKPMLHINLDIEDGWHIYPGKDSADELEGYIATQVILDLPDGITQAGAINWPIAHDFTFGMGDFREELKAYEDSPTITIPIDMSDAIANEQQQIGITLKYQACDDQICEMPTSTETILTFTYNTSPDATPPPTDEPDNVVLPDAGTLDTNQRVQLSLLWERSPLIQGDQVGLAIIMDIQNAWHIYPGEGSGDEYNYPTDIEITVPKDWVASDIQWPETHYFTSNPFPGETEQVPSYEGRAIAFAGITIPADEKLTTFNVKVTVEYQACDPSLCELPTKVTSEISISIDNANNITIVQPDVAINNIFTAFHPATAFPNFTETDTPIVDENPTAQTTNTETPKHGVLLWDQIRWWGVAGFVSLGMLFMIVKTIMISKRNSVRIAVSILGLIVAFGSLNAAKSLTAPPPDNWSWIPYSHAGFEEAKERGDIVVLDYTADWCINCKTVERAVLHNDNIMTFLAQPHVTAMIVDVTKNKGESYEKHQAIGGGGIPILAIYHPGDNKPINFSGLYTVGPVMTALQGNAAAVGEGHVFDFFGFRFSLGANAWPLVLLIALAAGFLLNFTPCVLPIIPIKILSLQAHAKNPGRCFFLGIIFGLGIITMFTILGILIGGLISGVNMDWGSFYQHWWVNLLLGLIIAVMALGMIGLFTTRLPGFVYMFNPQSDSVKGTFALGIFTAILSTPCTGPLLGATVAWVTTQPAWLALSTFIIMGVGMAFPYILLTANPKWIDRLPKTGPGSELIKQVMGILLLAAAVFFLGTVPLALGG